MNRSHKKYKHRFSKLKKHYKDAVKRQVARDFFLLSKSDINHDCLFVQPLAETDRLFEGRDEKEHTTSHSTNDEIYMQNGYASTAITLLNLIKISNDRFVRGCYINPVMFCFRQYLELSMKDSILRFRFMRKKANKDESKVQGHDLQNLWDGLVKYLTLDKTVISFGNLIKEFNDIDKSGTLFRYNEFLTKNICDEERKMPLIDIDNLYTRILQMYSFFECVNELARNGQDEMAANYCEYE